MLGLVGFLCAKELRSVWKRVQGFGPTMTGAEQWRLIDYGTQYMYVRILYVLICDISVYA